MMAAQYAEGTGEAANQLDNAHRQLLSDNSIQFELPTASFSPSSQPISPNYSPPPSYAPPSNIPPQTAPPAMPPQVPPPQAPVPVDSSIPSPAPDISPPSGGSAGLNGVMHVFLWIAAGIALAILLYWIFCFFRDRHYGGEAKEKKERRARKEKDAWRPEEEQAVQLLDEADMLANAGRYDEAARLLLHRSIGEIDAHRPDLVRPALTSRDIAGHPLLPAGPATAFARIAALVERSFFARRPLGPDDWQACRAAYREFAFAEGWRG